VRPDRRKDQAHLTGFDRGHAPSFVWEPELLEARKKHYEKVQRDSEKQRGEAGQRNKD
jgi:hypothetical protein